MSIFSKLCVCGGGFPSKKNKTGEHIFKIVGGFPSGRNKTGEHIFKILGDFPRGGIRQESIFSKLCVCGGGGPSGRNKAWVVSL